jgi:hypothetical protein
VEWIVILFILLYVVVVIATGPARRRWFGDIPSKLRPPDRGIPRGFGTGGSSVGGFGRGETRARRVRPSPHTPWDAPRSHLGAVAPPLSFTTEAQASPMRAFALLLLVASSALAAESLPAPRRPGLMIENKVAKG